MFTYFQEVEHDEHMLFAKEIAALYGTTTHIVAKTISLYELKQNGTEKKLFYKTKYGLARVYPKTIWIAAMNDPMLHTEINSTKT